MWKLVCGASPSPRFPISGLLPLHSLWRWEALWAMMESQGLWLPGMVDQPGPLDQLSEAGMGKFELPCPSVPPGRKPTGRGDRCPPTAERKLQGNCSGGRKQAPCPILSSFWEATSGSGAQCCGAGWCWGWWRGWELFNTQVIEKKVLGGRGGKKAKCVWDVICNN